MSDDNLRARYESRTSTLSALAENLDRATAEALDGIPHIDRIAFRVKDAESFLAKATKEVDDKPKYADPLIELEDQVGGRVITFFRDDLATVRTALTSWFGAVEREVKEPAGPKEFGYESEHFVFVIPEHVKPDVWSQHGDMPTTFEFQIRTLFMHAWAEPQHDLGYKGQDLDAETERELAWVAASAWGADRILNGIAARLIAADRSNGDDY